MSKSKNTKPCTYCGKVGHSSIMCFDKPRQPLKKKSRINTYGKKAKAWAETRGKWIQANPPDHAGYWYCYLDGTEYEHPLCPHALDVDQLTLDHVEPKGWRGDKIHDLDNLRPASSFCNGKKGSKRLKR